MKLKNDATYLKKAWQSQAQNSDIQISWYLRQCLHLTIIALSPARCAIDIQTGHKYKEKLHLLFKMDA